MNSHPIKNLLLRFEIKLRTKKEQMSQHNYLVGFVANNGYGSVFLKTDFKIKRQSDIEKVNKIIAEEFEVKKVSVFYFTELKKEKTK